MKEVWYRAFADYTPTNYGGGTDEFFLIIKRWHENPSCFKEIQIDTKGSGRYTISSYENDILTAGCHKIAYTEMERMYNEIINA